MTDSAGLLLFRVSEGNVLELLIGHMGGPFWAKKNEGGWSIPKGIRDDDSHDLLSVAEREFAEEMGRPAPDGPSLELGSVKSRDKRIHIWAREGTFDARTAVSNTFEMEWPPNSGQSQSFPEIDKAEWVNARSSRNLLVQKQVVFVERLLDHLRRSGREVLESAPPAPSLF